MPFQATQFVSETLTLRRRLRSVGVLADDFTAFAKPIGITQGVYFVDAMRVGLQGQARVRWGMLGVQLAPTPQATAPARLG